MILIDHPFVSDFLIKTIKENNFEIIATSQAKELNELPRGRAIEVSSEKNFIFSLMKTSGFQTFLFDHRGRASGNSLD